MRRSASDWPFGPLHSSQDAFTSDSLSEIEGCDLLEKLFAARGYRLARNIVFREYGVTFHIDAWDAAARVGFEFLTSEDDDHDDLTLEGYKTLMAAQQRGELSLFIIDEVETLSAAELTATAHDFLDEVAAAARARTRRGKRSRPATATGRKAAAANQPAGKKSAEKKPAGRRLTVKKARAAQASASQAAGKSKAGKKIGAGVKGKAVARPARKKRKRVAKASKAPTRR